MDMGDKARAIERVDGVRGVMITNKSGEIVYSKISAPLKEKLINVFPYLEDTSSLLKIKPKNLTVQFTSDLKIMILMKDDYAIYVLASRYVDTLGIKTLIE